ncbi:MAG: AtpZ/AtpI family protein [Gemmatimonadota bacterium]
MPRPEGDRATPRGSSPKPGALGQLGAHATRGLQFGITIALFLFGGFWLDQRWSTTPLFTIAGVALGAVGGFYALYRELTGGHGGDGGQRPPGGKGPCGPD